MKKLFLYGAIFAIFISSPTFGQEPLMSLTHTPGDLNVGIYNDGSIGKYRTGFAGPGVTWKGVDGCYAGGPILGASSTGTVNGDIGSFAIFDMQNLSSNFAGGFTSDPDFDQITEATIDDGLAPLPYGVEVSQHTYSNTGEEFVFLRYGFKNVTGSTIADFYAGTFVDWDIDAANFGTNSGGYALFDNLCYQFGTVAPEYYFGVVSLDGASGARSSTYGIFAGIRTESFLFMTSFDPMIDPNGDFRTWIGTSLGDIATGETKWATFAIVAGDDLSQIKQNAIDASVKSIGLGWTTTVLPVEVEVKPPLLYGLEQNFPNPFNPSTKINYQLPKTAFVTLKVYDVLGNEIATLVNEEKPVGSYEVEFNATLLSSGVYFYQLQAGSFIETKKMVLMK